MGVPGLVRGAPAQGHYTLGSVPPLQSLIVLACIVAAAVTVVGLFATRQYRFCYSFTAYLVSMVAFEGLIFLFPGRFYVWSFWIAKETVLTILKLGIALEILLRAFAAFPGARAVASWVLLGVLTLMLLGVLSVPAPERAPAGGALQTLAQAVMPRVTYGTLWALGGVLAAILWFHIPVARLHVAIVAALLPYLLLFTVVIHSWGATRWRFLGALDGLAYLIVLAYWCVVAWRRPPEHSDVPQEMLKTLQPWR